MHYQWKGHRNKREFKKSSNRSFGGNNVLNIIYRANWIGILHILEKCQLINLV